MGYYQQQPDTGRVRYNGPLKNGIVMIDQYGRLNGVPYFEPNPFLSASLLDPQKNTMFGQIRVVNHVLSKMAEIMIVKMVEMAISRKNTINEHR